jgi:hypothetical protein
LRIVSVSEPQAQAILDMPSSFSRSGAPQLEENYAQLLGDIECTVPPRESKVLDGVVKEESRT